MCVRLCERVIARADYSPSPAFAAAHHRSLAEAALTGLAKPLMTNETRALTLIFRQATMVDQRDGGGGQIAQRKNLIFYVHGAFHCRSSLVRSQLRFVCDRLAMCKSPSIVVWSPADPSLQAYRVLLVVVSLRPTLVPPPLEGFPKELACSPASAPSTRRSETRDTM